MRKSSLFFVSLVFLFIGFSKASFDDLKLLSVGFCTGSSSSIVVSPGEKRDLCMYFENISDKDIPIELDLIRSTETLDGTRGCSNVGSNKDDEFSQLFIIGDPGSNTITVPAHGSITKSWPFSIPAWVKGQKYGCMVYKSTESAPQSAGMFQFVYRNSIDLSLLVLDKEGAYKNNVDESFSMSINMSGEMIVSAKFASNADFDENVIFTGTISNILGFQKEFTQNFTLRVAETKGITLNLGKVPSYKGLFDLDVDGTYQPYFNGMPIDMEQFRDPVSFSDSASLFEFSPVALIVCAVPLLLLLLLIFVLFRKRKVVYVQAPIK